MDCLWCESCLDCVNLPWCSSSFDYCTNDAIIKELKRRDYEK